MPGVLSIKFIRKKALQYENLHAIVHLSCKSILITGIVVWHKRHLMLTYMLIALHEDLIQTSCIA
jgi:hypothetical protein